MPSHARDLRFTFAPVCGAPFDVIEFTLDEALSEPYRLCVQLSSFDAAVDFGAILDQPALFTIWRGAQATRHIHGIVSEFEQADTGFQRTRYRAVVEPSLARAALCSDWRIYQHLPAPEIMADVIKRQGISDYEQITAAEHLPREYCVQAGDTDLQFLHRLAAEEGYFYRYEHAEKSHRLIHADSIYSQGEIEGGPVVYNSAAGGDQPEPALRRFAYAERVRTAVQTQRDYTYTNPRYNQEHSPVAADLDHQAPSYERYDYPGRYKRDEAGEPYTHTRLLGRRRDARVAFAEGDDARLAPGLAFDLTGHPREEWNQGWRPVRMRHHGVQHASQEEEGAGSEQGTQYHYTAELVPDKVDWKPEPCPKPRIDGPQMATVVGPPNEELFCDSWGRVKVQFPWDRLGRHDEHSSCWIRVSQNWAGALWGHMAVPRIGQEVIVQFVDGDCDQPLIVGRTYCATNLPPYELPRHNILNTIKSKEHKGNRANELRLDDTSEQISAALMSDHGATALHLGYLTHPRPSGGEPRGEGFELRTDERGALRAAKGLLLTTEARIRARGGQLDRSEIVGVLEAALELARNLGEYAGEHEGVAHDAAPQQSLAEAVRDLGGGANDEADGPGDGGQSAIALSAPAGIAAGTPAGITLTAGAHIDSIAQQNQQISAGERVVVNAGGDLGLFTQGGDMRHIAHQGEMLLQAQRNHIRVQADQSVEITASKQHVLIGADKHITLLCAGAYIRMAGGNIELGMPGTFTVKAASHNFSGPTGRSAALPAFKSPEAAAGDYAGRFRLRKTDERDFQRYRYRIMAGGTLLLEGLTDQNGETEFIDTPRARSVQTYKTIMRDDQRIPDDPDALVGELDVANPHFPEPGLRDEEFLDQHGEGDAPW
ncbi:type VI secretion system Vgr family protein [Achromobacter sp. NPDC058515]|uniref:type VI secretion system Vgr family protein n=1 Tax=Achromobacter sp. NPDC058515 TaxID=3346533 RepID=UPI003665B435